MVHPDMATVLGLLTTDAALSAEQLDDLLRRAMDKSFNRISVDGDTSTNDTVLALANGHSGVAIGSEADQKLLSEAFDRLCIDLAKMLVLDGEGASKFVEIQIDGAPDDESAHRIANTIAISPLVKTAIAGGDANWGRFVMAAGRAGVEFDQSRVDLWIGQGESASLQLVRQGTPTDYLEEDAAAIFASQAIKVYLDLHAGRGSVVVWTCDLTHDYVSINADYRT